MKLCLCMLLAACVPETYASKATDTFASTYSCPAERQTLVRQGPPTDIARDPERLEMWNTQSAALECFDGEDHSGHPWVACITHPTTAAAR